MSLPLVLLSMRALRRSKFPTIILSPFTDNFARFSNRSSFAERLYLPHSPPPTSSSLWTPSASIWRSLRKIFRLFAYTRRPFAMFPRTATHFRTDDNKLSTPPPPPPHQTFNRFCDFLVRENGNSATFHRIYARKLCTNKCRTTFYFDPKGGGREAK